MFELVPSQYLSKNEIEAAKLVHVDVLNVQNQHKAVWPARFVVARAYMDQLVRNDGLRRAWATPVSRELDRAEKLTGAEQKTALAKLATKLDGDVAGAGDSAKVRALAGVVRDLANGKK